MKIKLMGKVWTFVREKLEYKDNAKGYCESPKSKYKKIVVDSRLEGEKELEIIIHELLHACFWVLSEEHVHQSAEDIARVLTRLDYAKRVDE